MLDLLDMFWPLGFFAGAFFLLAGHATQSIKHNKNYFEEAYKWARNGGLILLAAMFLLWLLRVQHYWHSISISN